MMRELFAWLPGRMASAAAVVGVVAPTNHSTLMMAKVAINRI